MIVNVSDAEAPKCPRIAVLGDKVSIVFSSTKNGLNAENPSGVVGVFLSKRCY